MTRPKILKSETHCSKMGCGKVYMTICYKFGQPYEVFIRKGKAGGCQSALLQSIARVINCALEQTEITKKDDMLTSIIKTLTGIECPERLPGDLDNQSKSCIDDLAKKLKLTQNGKYYD